MTAPLSQRQLRVGETIRHALAETLTRDEVQDGSFDMRLITVPEVRMSPDLKHATVYVMPLGGRDEEGALKALERNRRYLRGVLAKRVKMKFLPELHFRIDETFARGEKIDHLLREVKKMSSGEK
jgi:ribosome-binding factor A